jgi:hypothetical protein
MLTAHHSRINPIEDKYIQNLTEFVGVNYRKDFELVIFLI